MGATAKFAALFVTCLLPVLLCAKPLGIYIATVMEGQRNSWTRWGSGVEKLLYRVSGIDRRVDMTWLEYAKALLLFNALGALCVYALQRLQALLPLNPQHFAAVNADSAF